MQTFPISKEIDDLLESVNHYEQKSIDWEALFIIALIVASVGAFDVLVIWSFYFVLCLNP